MVRTLARCNFSITGLVSLLMRFSNTINPNRVKFFSTSCLSNLSILMSLVLDGRSLIAKAMGKNIQINYFLLILQEMALVLYLLSCRLEFLQDAKFVNNQLNRRSLAGWTKTEPTKMEFFNFLWLIWDH